MLERWSARLAALHATAPALDRMRGLLDRMDDPALPRVEFNESDTAFHVALAEAGGNRLVADMTKAIREAVRQPLLHALQRTEDWAGTVAELRAEHRAVFDAVAAGDATAAADGVEKHVRGFFAGLHAS